MTWSSKSSAIPGARSDDDGAANTAAIIAALPQDNPGNNAAWLCHNYRDLEGHTDWYLPSKNELNKMYLYARNHNLIGRDCSGDRVGGVQCLLDGYYERFNIYWSSTEYSGDNGAWYQDFSSSGQGYANKIFSYLDVRAEGFYQLTNSTSKQFTNATNSASGGEIYTAI